MRRQSAAIDEHAIIGDGRSAALVAADGTVDWLCWPRFDSPSLFAALVDPENGGGWRIAPTRAARVARRYLRGTNVLETRFATGEGLVVLTDLMPVATEEQKRRLLLPEHEVLRAVTCVSGTVELDVVYAPRPGYGEPGRPPRLRQRGALGLCAETREGLLVLRGDAPLTVNDDGDTARGRITLRAGQTARFSLVMAVEGPAVLSPLGAHAAAQITRTMRFWRNWSQRARYDGVAREQVVRSALALKLLVFAPSGAIVAAPTTSLPERPGGDLNWDYRYCWLRDAALTARALLGLGYHEATEAFVSWLLHATALTQPELEPLYEVYGRRPPRERTVPWLHGHGGAKPVRVGNAAAQQRQLDVYGEVIDAVALLYADGRPVDRETQRLLVAMGNHVCAYWREPDEGIWEVRSGRYHHTHSRVLCWTALDRLLTLSDRGQLPGAPTAHFALERARVREEVETAGLSATHGTYKRRMYTSDDNVDAALLLLDWYGYTPPGAPRLAATARRIVRELGSGPDGALLRRYPDDESPGEGAFGLCGFWLVDHLARGGGTLEEAHERFAELLGYANDVGLYGEELDPRSGAALGNFPQGFTHVGLINAALSIAEREGRLIAPHRRRFDERGPREGWDRPERPEAWL